MVRVHPAKYRSASLYWQTPVVLSLLLAALFFNIFREKPNSDIQNSKTKKVSIVVLGRNVEEGTILSIKDLKYKKFALSELPEGYFLKRKKLLGCQTRGPVPRGFPLVQHFIADTCQAKFGKAKSRKKAGR